jgi:hypothetical protein
MTKITQTSNQTVQFPNGSLSSNGTLHYGPIHLDTHLGKTSTIKNLPFNNAQEVPCIPKRYLNNLELSSKPPEALSTLKGRAARLQTSLNAYQNSQTIQKGKQVALVAFGVLCVAGIIFGLPVTALLSGSFAIAIGVTYFCQQTLHPEKKSLELFENDTKKLVSYMKEHGNELENAIEKSLTNCQEVAKWKIDDTSSDSVLNEYYRARANIKILGAMKLEIAKAKKCVENAKTQGPIQLNIA